MARSLRCLRLAVRAGAAVLSVVAGGAAFAAESDLWTSHSGPGAVIPGSPFTVTVGYGNLGPDTAGSAYVNSWFTAPMGLDVFVDDTLNGSGVLFDTQQASAEGTDTLGNAPLLFWDDFFCEELLFQLQRDDGDVRADPIEGLDPGVSASFSYDVVVPMAAPNLGTVEILQPPSLREVWSASTGGIAFTLQAAALNVYGRGSCERLVGGAEDDVCEFIEDNCFAARLSLLDTPIEADFELVDDGSADPTLGCGPLVGFTPGNIAVVRRGVCEFGDKGLNAEQAGAAALFMVNDGRCSDFPQSDQCVVSMGSGALGGLVSIPMVLVAQADGEPVIAAIQSGADVRGLFGGASRFSAAGTAFLADFSDTDPDDSNDASRWEEALAGVGCSYLVEPGSAVFPPSGGNGEIDVATGAECPWSAWTTAAWVTFPGGAGSTGSGTVSYEVAPNLGPGRATAVEIADRTHYVSQQAGNGCSVAVEPGGAHFPGLGGNGAVELVVPLGCSWSAAPTRSWLDMTSPAAGIGPATLTYTVMPGTSRPRSGAILVGEAVHAVDQDARSGCDLGEVADDGTAENGYGWGTGSAFVQRVTPAGYPFVLSDVCVAFTQAGGDPTLEFRVIVLDDDGPGGGPGTRLGSVEATAYGVPPWLDHVFVSVDVAGTGTAVDGGSVYVGVEWDNVEEQGFYVAADESPSTPPRDGFLSANGGLSWIPINPVFPGYRSLLLRVDGRAVADGEWQQMVGAAGGGGNGFGDQANSAVSAAIGVGGAMVVGTENPTGAGLFRTEDGAAWSDVSSPLFPNAANDRISLLVPVGGQLHAATLNPSFGAEVWVLTGPGSWTLSGSSGFGDPDNIEVPSGAVFGGLLYVGTRNAGGCQVWRSFGFHNWDQVHTAGFGNPLNVAAESMAVFDGELWVGTRNPDGAELWRSPDGVVWFPAMTGGFGSTGNLAVTDLEVFRSSLYAGVSNSATGAQVWRFTGAGGWQQVEGAGFGDPERSALDDLAIGDVGLLAAASGPSSPGAVWLTEDGSSWSAFSSPGFRNPGNERVGPMAYWDDRIWAGTANSADGCEVWRSARHPVFADGFESGGTAAWALASP